MKKTVSFRLSDKTLGMLAGISEETNMTMTQIVNESIEEYIEKLKRNKAGLLAYAGTLGSNDADEILKAIKHNKKNKKTENRLEL
ncbi:MAG: hypothetical protein M1407_00705 [Deltaproteobacteria bacterium]|nr:hypothetical protein [Deltaproteobacteria bacterium]